MQEEINNALEVLKHGGVIIYPTDTVWGIGCDACNMKAVEKVYRIKHRSETKSMIILVSDMDMLHTYVKEIPFVAKELIQSVEHPLTIIYPSARNLAKNVITSDGTAAIRIVKEEFCHNLIAAFGKPIVSSSANLSGDETPLFFSKISQDILDAADYVVNLNRDKMIQVKSSTIIKVYKNGEYEIIRN